VTRFKIDENLHPDVASIMRKHGHDVLMVWDEGLRGTSDTNLSHVCRTEGRVLITLDLDFADIRTYPPEEHQGVIVLRLKSQGRQHVVDAIGRIVPLLEDEALVNRLWIVDEQSVRIRGKETEGP